MLFEASDKLQLNLNSLLKLVRFVAYNVEVSKTRRMTHLVSEGYTIDLLQQHAAGG